MKRRQKLKLDTASMKTRLQLTLLLAGVFLTLVITAAGYKTFERTLIAEIGNNRADVLRQIGDRVQQVKQNAYTLSNLYYYDASLGESLAELSLHNTETNRQAFIRQMNRMTTQYKNSFHEGSTQFQIVLALEFGGGYNSDPEASDGLYMSPKTKIWYKRMLFAKGDMIDIANYKDKSSGTNYFSVARAMEGTDGEPMAYLMVNMDEEQILAMYAPLIRENQNTIYVVDSQGTIVSCNNRKLIGFEFFHMENLNGLFGDKAYTFTSMRGQNILFTRYYDKDSGFTVLEEIPLSVLMEPIRNVRFASALVAILAILGAALYAGHLSDKVTRPISQLCDFMMQVEENNLDQECKVAGYTEINILSKGLNSMLGRMRDLLWRIKQKEQQKRDLEIGFLQAQINPHFLYNTLFSIKCMVDMQKNEAASNMLKSFIQLLRGTLSAPGELVTIRQEFEILKQYLDIQKFRYDDGFQVVFECDEKVEDKKIPKLLIQPILENAIFHGVELKKGEGLIILTARLCDDTVVVTVEDNGVGIDPATLEHILQGKAETGEAHIGLVNVKDRIQLNFGERYGMQIESRQWEGTKVILTFPVITQEEVEDESTDCG